MGLGPDIFRNSGKHNAAATEKGADLLKDYARHLEDLGEPCERLDARRT